MFLQLQQHKLTNQLWSLPTSVSEPYSSVIQIFPFSPVFIIDTPSATPHPPPIATQLPVFRLPSPSHRCRHPSLTPVVNNSNELGPEEELALAANETSVTLQNLKYSPRYKFYLNARTSVGAGPAISQEAVVKQDEGKSSKADKCKTWSVWYLR